MFESVFEVLYAAETMGVRKHLFLEGSLFFQSLSCAKKTQTCVQGGRVLSVKTARTLVVKGFILLIPVRTLKFLILLIPAKEGSSAFRNISTLNN
jgi:hypothetical protein